MTAKAELVPVPAEWLGAKLVARRDGASTRVAIVLEFTGPPGETPSNGHASESIDVLRADGTLLCRINAFQFPGGAGDVDVILDPATQRGRFLAWSNGSTVVDAQTPAGTTAHAVDIRPVGAPA